MVGDPTILDEILYAYTASGGALGLAAGGLLTWRRSLRGRSAALALVLGLALGLGLGVVAAMTVIANA
jgi:hypothetical protein